MTLTPREVEVLATGIAIGAGGALALVYLAAWLVVRVARGRAGWIVVEWGRDK